MYIRVNTVNTWFLTAYVGGVDELVWDGEFDWKRHGVGQVPTPPRLLMRAAVDALDKDQQTGVDSQDGVAKALGSGVPVDRGAAGAPACAAVGLVLDVHGNDVPEASVSCCHILQAGLDSRLGVVLIVPQLGDVWALMGGTRRWHAC